MDTNRSNRRNWVGIVLVVLGLGILLKNLNILPLPSYFLSWKTLLIAVGIIAIALGKRDGFIPLFIGAFFLVFDIFGLHYSNFKDLWPLVLIIIGVALLIKHRAATTSNELNAPNIDEVAIFSSLEKKVTSQEFNGGKTTAIFGGADIDLRQSSLTARNNVIDILTMFGGTTFKVPTDWTVNISQLTILFGSFVDERVVDTSKTDPNKVLHIKGLILFGGGELKNG